MDSNRDISKDILQEIAKIQKEVSPNHHSVDGIVNGTFAGISPLNVNEAGNVVLTRMANSEDHLTKKWVTSNPEDMLNTSLFTGGGNGLPTSGMPLWEQGYNSNANFKATFEIPPKDLYEAIRASNALVGNIGEGEIVLNPEWAKDYLKTVNKESVYLGKDGSILLRDTNQSISHLESNTNEKVIDKSNSNIDVHPDFHGKFSEWNPTTKTENQKKSSIKDFFGNRLKSFDTETTGLDYRNRDIEKRDRIWQVGLAIDGASGVEEHTSPFFVSKNNLALKPMEKMDEDTLKNSLKTMTGKFSEKAFEEGNFNEFIKQYNSDNLSSLNRSLKSTLGLIESSDVVVLQNMNFENNMLRSSLEQGLITKDLYEDIASRMQTTSINLSGDTGTLFQRPYRVQRRMREADKIYNTRYLKDLSEDSFQTYKEHVNKAIAEYTTTINDPKRVGAVAVELQDITKAVLVNAADQGYIDKQTATLGLNIDFLSNALLGYSESHTALKDSEDTISLFKKLWEMNEDLTSGVEISESTKANLSKIKQGQSEEINKKFMRTVRSVLDDFNKQSFTRITNSETWYSPELLLKEQTASNYQVKKLEEIEVGHSTKERNLLTSLDTVYSRYSNFSENILNFNRFQYLEGIKEDFENGISVESLHKKVDDDIFNYIPDKTQHNPNINIVSDIPTETNNIKTNNSFWDQKTTLFGKEMKVKTKATLLGGIGAGLAYMAMTPKPPPQEYNDSNVSEQFYDEQYLGTAFLDFKERNKHYMM